MLTRAFNKILKLKIYHKINVWWIFDDLFGYRTRYDTIQKSLYLY